MRRALLRHNNNSDRWTDARGQSGDVSNTSGVFLQSGGDDLSGVTTRSEAVSPLVVLRHFQERTASIL